MLRAALSPQRIRLQQNAGSKKKALELCAEILAESNEELNQDKILEALNAREKLGSTALEHGVALPHCRISGCPKPLCALVTLREGVDFEARDKQPANLLCALIVPEDAAEEHLEILASIAALLGSEVTRQAILASTDSSQLYLEITESQY
ncbi:MAG: PTS sugar transporter subunit IIA, partial [Pseudomonadales bacterium]|nr:PTS sugar transporter subunit IIA [Pseudomonadales bacterium]